MIIRICPTCSHLFLTTHRIDMAFRLSIARYITRLQEDAWNFDRHVWECKSEWASLVRSYEKEATDGLR